MLSNTYSVDNRCSKVIFLKTKIENSAANCATVKCQNKDISWDIKGLLRGAGVK